jgi:hypothetical protein
MWISEYGFRISDFGFYKKLKINVLYKIAIHNPKSKIRNRYYSGKAVTLLFTSSVKIFAGLKLGT